MSLEGKILQMYLPTNSSSGKYFWEVSALEIQVFFFSPRAQDQKIDFYKLNQGTFLWYMPQKPGFPPAVGLVGTDWKLLANSVRTLTMPSLFAQIWL